MKKISHYYFFLWFSNKYSQRNVKIWYMFWLPLFLNAALCSRYPLPSPIIWIVSISLKIDCFAILRYVESTVNVKLYYNCIVLQNIFCNKVISKGNQAVLFCIGKRLWKRKRRWMLTDDRSIPIFCHPTIGVRGDLILSLC